MIVLGRVITLYRKKQNQEHAPTSQVHSFTKSHKKVRDIDKKIIKKTLQLLFARTDAQP